MQIWAVLGVVVIILGAVGGAGWKGYEMGQGACRLEVVNAAASFRKRRGTFNGRIDGRNQTRAQGRADKGEKLNDLYEDALDVIAMYDLQLGKCNVPGPVREAIGKIR